MPSPWPLRMQPLAPALLPFTRHHEQWVSPSTEASRAQVCWRGTGLGVLDLVARSEQLPIG